MRDVNTSIMQQHLCPSAIIDELRDGVGIERGQKKLQMVVRILHAADTPYRAVSLETRV